MNYLYQIEGDLKNNIGDVLQGMVAKRFLRNTPKVVDRERLSEIKFEGNSFLIANGWYIHNFEHFPPPPSVTPFYVSVHIANSEFLKKKEVRDHFYKNSPIGCRDKKTLKLFLGWGIPAYYSNCLTITCEKPTSIENTTDEILLVDNVDHPLPDSIQLKLQELIGSDLKRISHDPPFISENFQEYCLHAEEHMKTLLTKYCKSKLIITTKIHCALPCLGMGANVVLIHPNPSDPRLATVREFIDIISYADIAKLTHFVKPKINTERLNKHKSFLIQLATDAVTTASNPIKHPINLTYRLMKVKSILNAFMFRCAIQILIKTGLSNQHINRVYKK